jgi:hypothetical protein
MADSGGHWKTLAEAQKLTQSMKIPGVQEEDIKRVNLVDRVPVAQAAHSGKKIEWLREKTTTEEAVNDVTVGTQLSWSDDIEYEEKETELKTVYIQRKLDKFVQNIYGTYNNYEARKLLECEKGMKRRIGARFVYGDTTYTSSLQMDGIHALAAEHGTAYDSSNATNDPKNIDNGEAGLSLAYLRIMMDEMKLGVDEIWAPFEIVRRMDAAFQERGFLYTVSGTTQVHNNLGFITLGWNELGKRVLFWDGIPITRTDYLVAEQANTGTGASSDARGLYSSGDKQYSLFAVRKGSGSLDGQNPGLTFLYGGTEGQGDLYKLVRFPELEDYDAGGIRLVSYIGSMLPSSLALGRIFDIEDAAITI